MKLIVAFLLAASIISCKSLRSTSNDEYATYYVVISKTGKNYHDLRRAMEQLHHTSSLPIDTMGRYFNEQRQKLILSESDEDEIYAGSYFPRRFPSEHLSIEYLAFYDEQSDSLTFALVSGIYENKAKADSALKSLRMTIPETHVMKSKIFVGCLH